MRPAGGSSGTPPGPLATTAGESANFASVWSSFDGQPTAPVVRMSETESARYGWRVGRLEIHPASETTPEQVVELGRASGAEIVVARFDARHLDWFARLQQRDVGVIAAGTIVYWGCDTDPDEGTSAPRSCTLNELRTVIGIVESTFDGYVSHYSANPLLGGSSTPSGYAEWLSTFVDARDRDVIVVGEGEAITGFAAVELVGSAAEVALAGIAPYAQRQGWYGRLMRSCKAWATGQDVARLVISTQVSNIAVQTAWAGLGLVPIGAFETVHVCFGPAAQRLAAPIDHAENDRTASTTRS